MNEIRFLVDQFGGSWCGVRFGPPGDETTGSAAYPMPFCTAVAESRKRPIILTPELMDCPGGSRSMGWNGDDAALAEKIAEKAELPVQTARSIIDQTPKFPGDVQQVVLGTSRAPDIVLSYAQPEAAMKCLLELQRLYGKEIVLETSGFMSVCGSVAVKAYLSGTICVSFGCPNAREYAGMGRDRLIIGLPLRQLSGIRRVEKTVFSVRKELTER